MLSKKSEASFINISHGEAELLPTRQAIKDLDACCDAINHKAGLGLCLLLSVNAVRNQASVHHCLLAIALHMSNFASAPLPPSLTQTFCFQGLHALWPCVRRREVADVAVDTYLLGGGLRLLREGGGLCSKPRPTP